MHHRHEDFSEAASFLSEVLSVDPLHALAAHCFPLQFHAGEGVDDLFKPGVTRKEGLLRSHTFEASGALRSLGQHSWKQSGNMFLMIIRFSLYWAAYLFESQCVAVAAGG